jgi:hypothetical protein
MIYSDACWGLPPEVRPVDGGAIPLHAARKTIKTSDAALKSSLVKAKTPLFMRRLGRRRGVTLKSKALKTG